MTAISVARVSRPNDMSLKLQTISIKQHISPTLELEVTGNFQHMLQRLLALCTEHEPLMRQSQLLTLAFDAVDRFSRSADHHALTPTLLAIQALLQTPHIQILFVQENLTLAFRDGDYSDLARIDEHLQRAQAELDTYKARVSRHMLIKKQLGHFVGKLPKYFVRTPCNVQGISIRKLTPHPSIIKLLAIPNAFPRSPFTQLVAPIVNSVYRIVAAHVRVDELQVAFQPFDEADFAYFRASLGVVST